MLSPELFRRQDESSDLKFYSLPRFVTHIDDSTIEALRQFYREILPEGGDLLDLMSSWISHLPEDVAYHRVSGLGLNQDELTQNPRLTDSVVHDLNTDPELPYADGSFDAVINAVSVQYLIQPVEVFASVRRVLRPGGRYIVAMSQRLFPSKAIMAFQTASPDDRVRLVTAYFDAAGGFEPAVFLDCSPARGDPLWVVMTQRSNTV